MNAALFSWEVLEFRKKGVVLVKVTWVKEAFVQRKYFVTVWSSAGLKLVTQLLESFFGGNIQI